VAAFNGDGKNKGEITMTEEIIKQDNSIVTLGEGTGALEFRSDEEMNSFLEQVERRNTAIDRMLKMALAKLQPEDFHDFNGKPMLQGIGAQRLIKFFGITVSDMERVPAIGYEICEGDIANRLRVTFRATFKLGSMEITGEGMRDTHNQLFCKTTAGYKEIADIELPNLDRAAKTAMYRDGVATLLGLKGLTWKYLKNLGFSPDQTTGHSYQTGSQGGNAASSAEAKTKQAEIANMIFEMSGQDPEKSKEMLMQYTEWTNKKGEVVAGKDSVSKLSDKQVPLIHRKVKEDYDKFIPDNPEQTEQEPDELQGKIGF
jgi:hypothetical protein